MKKKFLITRSPSPPLPPPSPGAGDAAASAPGNPRRPWRTCRVATVGGAPSACAALIAVALAIPGWCTPALGNVVGAGVKLRQARTAIADGHLATARVALEEIRASEPSGPRHLEATLLLADVVFTTGSPEEADRLLGEIESAGLDVDRPRVSLSRAWLALAGGATAVARSRFTALAGDGNAAVREPATLGIAWTSLIEGRSTSLDDLEPLRRMARRADDPALRFGAGWTLGRAHQVAGRARHALRELRALRRLARGTPYEDDVELEIALAQIGSGVPAAARRTLDRLSRRHDPGAAPPPLLTLDQLRASPPQLAAHVVHAYSARAERFVGPLGFLAGVLNRPAAADVPAARELTGSALAGQLRAGRSAAPGTAKEG